MIGIGRVRKVTLEDELDCMRAADYRRRKKLRQALPREIAETRKRWDALLKGGRRAWARDCDQKATSYGTAQFKNVPNHTPGPAGQRPGGCGAPLKLLANIVTLSITPAQVAICLKGWIGVRRNTPGGLKRLAELVEADCDALTHVADERAGPQS
jgi:hypothetical protein